MTNRQQPYLYVDLIVHWMAAHLLFKHLQAGLRHPQRERNSAEHWWLNQ